jgi:hypothetical protein
MNETCDQSALCISVITDMCLHEWETWPECIVYISLKLMHAFRMRHVTRVIEWETWPESIVYISWNWYVCLWMRHVTRVHWIYQLELMYVFMNETRDQSALWISVGTDVCVNKWDTWPECIVYSWMRHMTRVHCFYQLELMCVFMNEARGRLR